MRIALLVTLVELGCTSCPVVAPQKPAVIEPAKPVPVQADSWRDDVLAFVKLGYGDDLGREHRSLHFRTEALSTTVAQQAVALVKAYNAFDGAKVAAGLERLRGDIMYYEFGREDSPVLYVHLPYWTNQQERNCPAQHCREGAWGDRAGARELSPADHDALAERVRGTFTSLQADEIDGERDDHVFRVWWD